MRIFLNIVYNKNILIIIGKTYFKYVLHNLGYGVAISAVFAKFIGNLM